MASMGCMQLKHVVAVGLSVLLLCVSSWASVCELSCSLSHAYPEPARGSSATQAHELSTSEANAPHSHCGHAKAARPSSAANHSFESTSQCTNAPCAQAQTLSSPVNGRDDARPEGVHFAVVASGPAVASNILSGSAKHGRALTKLLLLDLLSVGLRI
jgi:hypothetical protein